MPTKCSNCGEIAVEWDEHGGTAEHQVCSACGVVHSDGQLVAVSNDHSTAVSNSNRLPGLPDNFRRYQYDRLPEGLKVGKNHIRTLCSVISVNSSYMNESLDLYEDLYWRKGFKRSLTETKIQLAIWCVYISCRRGNMPITMQYMSMVTGQPNHKLFRVHHCCKDVLKFNLPTQDITELVDTVLKSDLSADVSCSAEAKQLTRELLALCKELWLTEGRKTHILIIAAFFIAWQAEEFIQRRKVKVLSICKTTLNCRSIRSRVLEFRKMLCQLAGHIPWLTSEVTLENVGYHVKDVVRFQRSLLMDAFRTKQQQLTTQETSEGNQTVESETGNQSEGTSSSATSDERLKTPTVESDRWVLKQVEEVVDRVEQGSPSEGSIETSEISPKNLENEIKKRNLGEAPIENQTRFRRDILQKSKRQSESDKKRMEATERDLFVPPAFKKARRRSRDQNEILELLSEGRRVMDNIASQIGEDQ